MLCRKRPVEGAVEGEGLVLNLCEVCKQELRKFVASQGEEEPAASEELVVE